MMQERSEVFGPVLHPTLELIENLLVRRKVPRLQLRVNEFPVQAHLKTTAIPWDELQRTKPITERIHDRLRQAHGLWDVVSSHTIFDGDFLILLRHA